MSALRLSFPFWALLWRKSLLQVRQGQLTGSSSHHSRSQCLTFQASAPRYLTFDRPCSSYESTQAIPTVTELSLSYRCVKHAWFARVLGEGHVVRSESRRLSTQERECIPATFSVSYGLSAATDKHLISLLHQPVPMMPRSAIGLRAPITALSTELVRMAELFVL